jgi:arylsulfatase A
VMFSSDNGPTFNRMGGSDSEFFESADEFRGFKGSLYEGGIRVPLVAKWPGHIEPGRVTDHVAAFWDVMPTIADLTGTMPPEGIDGISFAPTLTGDEEQTRHEFLYWEFPASGGQQAVRMENWKGIRQNMLKRNNPDRLKIELYNLADDPGETTDVAGEHPDVVAQIRQIMQREHTPSALFPFPPIDREAK